MMRKIVIAIWILIAVPVAIVFSMVEMLVGAVKRALKKED